MSPAAEKILLRMADLCARSEQCEYDLRKKLARAKILPGEATQIIDTLRQRGFINHERYARAFANDKVRFSAWGRLKIKQALHLKQIPTAIIDSALNGISKEDYLQALKKNALAKARTLSLAVYSDRQKLYRYLATKGFEPSLIANIIEKLTPNS